MTPASKPPLPSESRPPRHFERLVESLLWNSRLLFGVAALACLLLALGLLWISTLDAFHMLALSVQYAEPSLESAVRKSMRVELVGDAIKALDGFLLAMALLISAFGIYELFVSELSEAHAHALAGRILVIRSLDDLKSRLGKVVLVIMVVTLFEAVLDFHAVTALDLLGIAGAIALAAGALYVNHRDSHDHHP